MSKITLFIAGLLVFASANKAQTQEVKFIADTLLIQAEGTFEGDPDLATLIFDVSSQDKELKAAYDRASQAMQKISALGEKNGLKKEDISGGPLTVTPNYGGDRKRRAKSFFVQGQISLRVRDFSKLGTIIEESVTDDTTDFRSLTYSLADEEAAKQHAVAEAMRRALGRANAALAEKGQKVGALRFASLDVKQLVGVARFDVFSEIQVQSMSSLGAKKVVAAAPPPPPLPRPEKITVSATAQCAFQIQ